MKIIHCADLHLGSKIEAKLPPEKAQERRREVRSAFTRLVDHAKRAGVKVIMLSGDVFDADRPPMQDKQFFYSVVRAHPEIDFLYLRGNHDGGEAYTEQLKNLKTFSTEWTSYPYGNTVIHGVEIGKENAASFYGALKTDPTKKNIVMLHGQIADSVGEGLIKLSLLAGKGIDYLALGHVHSYKTGALDTRGRYAYCGCLEGRGFDECGEKGFILLDDETMEIKFVKNSLRCVKEERVDISACKSAYSAYQTVLKALSARKSDLLLLRLVGEIEFDGDGLERELSAYLENDFYFVSVKNETTTPLPNADMVGGKTIMSAFLAELERSEELTETDKKKIYSVAVKALYGQEE